MTRAKAVELENVAAAESADATELSRLVAEARCGCEVAASALVERFQRRVIGLVRLHLPRGEDPADIAQDVFVKVFRRLHQYRNSAPLWNWISKITVRTCIDRTRYHQRRPAVSWSDLSEEQRETLENWEGDSVRRETRDIDAREILETLLTQLDPAERMLIRLLELEQQSPAEVAAATGWSRGNVRVRAFRARQKLKSAYRRLERSVLP